MSHWSCAIASNFLTASVLSETRLTWPWRSHLSGCLRCQAHLASVRATRRRLGDMRFENVGLPSGLDQTFALGLLAEGSTISGRSGRRAAAASAAVAAVALAAGWMWRRARDSSFEVRA